MAGEGVSSLILLTTSIVVAIIVSGAIFYTAYHFRDSMNSREKLEEQFLKTKIVIINDLHYSPYNPSSNTITIYVKNIGETELNMNHTTVILNGTPYALSYPDTIRPIKSGVKQWLPQVTVNITFQPSKPLSSGDYILTVVVDYGVKATIKFRV